MKFDSTSYRHQKVFNWNDVKGYHLFNIISLFFSKLCAQAPKNGSIVE